MQLFSQGVRLLERDNPKPLSRGESAQEEPSGLMLNLPQGFSHLCRFILGRQGPLHRFHIGELRDFYIETKEQDRQGGAFALINRRWRDGLE